MKRNRVTTCILLVLIGALFFVWRWSSDDAPATPDETFEAVKNTPTKIEENTIITSPSSGVDQSTPPLSTETDMASQSAEKDMPPSVVEAMASMSRSLSEGDARTPALAPEVERQKPAPDVLADPQRYAEYEEAQSRSIAAGYLSMLNQIPTLRERIDAAKASGSQTPEDIAEAEEALAKLEELKREIERTHPEMLQATPNSPDPQEVDNRLPE